MKKKSNLKMINYFTRNKLMKIKLYWMRSYNEIKKKLIINIKMMPNYNSYKLKKNIIS